MFDPGTRDWYRNGTILEAITSIQAVQITIQANIIQEDPTIIQVVLTTIQATLTLEVPIIIPAITIQAVQTTIQASTIPEDQTITSLDFVPVGGAQDPNPADRIITTTNPVTMMDNALDK